MVSVCHRTPNRNAGPPAWAGPSLHAAAPLWPAILIVTCISLLSLGGAVPEDQLVQPLGPLLDAALGGTRDEAQAGAVTHPILRLAQAVLIAQLLPPLLPVGVAALLQLPQQVGLLETVLRSVQRGCGSGRRGERWEGETRPNPF